MISDDEIRAIWNQHWDGDLTLTENVCRVVRESIKYQARFPALHPAEQRRRS